MATKIKKVKLNKMISEYQVFVCETLTQVFNSHKEAIRFASKFSTKKTEG